MGSFKYWKRIKWQVKKLEIKPKTAYLQIHKYRSEHWVLLMEQPKEIVKYFLKKMKIPIYQMVQT